MVQLIHLAVAAAALTSATVTKRSEPQYALVRIHGDTPAPASSGPNVEYMLIGSSIFGLLGQLFGGAIGAGMPKNTTFTGASIMAGVSSEINSVKGAIAQFQGGGASAMGGASPMAPPSLPAAAMPKMPMTMPSAASMTMPKPAVPAAPAPKNSMQHSGHGM